MHNQGRGKASGGQGKLAHLQELNDAACDDAKPIKCVDSEYRTVSGVCNNLAHPTWGMASIAMRRYTPAQYSDQNGAPRGNLKSASGHCETGDKNTFQKPQHCFPDPSALLPNPRHASTQFHTEATVDDTVYTHMVTQMGQFLDHDITFTPEAEAECCVKGKRVEESGGGEEDCFPIGIPCKEEHFTEDFLGKSERNTAPLQRQYGGSGGSSGCDENSLEFFRSVAFCDGEKVKREQMNGITAFVDASNVYGSSQDVNEALRDMSTGMMLVDGNGLLPEINGTRTAGDVRALEMPGLAAMHTLFIREHNRIAKHFIAGGMLSPEEVYLKTRKIVSAEMQNIVYGHYLTAVLGEETMAKSGMKLIAGVHSNYDSNVDPSVFNAFATAAYRFGHSKIQGLIQMISTTTGVATSYNLRDVFFELANYLQNNGDGMEQILNGLIQQAALKNDRFVSEDVTDFLFANNGQHPGSDLIARNIQRGRDHGLPGYNDFRKVCQLPQACTWDSAPDEISPSDWELLSTLYDDPRDIDLFVAGMAETPYAGGIVGRTFNCLLTKQFQVITNQNSLKDFTLSDTV